MTETAQTAGDGVLVTTWGAKRDYADDPPVEEARSRAVPPPAVDPAAGAAADHDTDGA